VTAAPQTRRGDPHRVVRAPHRAELTTAVGSAPLATPRYHAPPPFTVADLMTTPPYVTDPKTPIDEIVHRILSLGHQEIVVTVDRRPVGILTQWHLATLLKPTADGWPPRYAADLLPPSTPHLPTDLHPARAAAVMTRHHLEALPVVGSRGLLLGVIAHRHLIGHLADQAMP
jgi:CBS domain-containing protein